MANFYTDNEDLRFYMERGIDWAPLVKLNEHGFRAEGGFKNLEEALEVYREIMNLVGEFAADEVMPKIPAIDREGVHLADGEVVTSKGWQQIFDRLKQLELHGMCLPRELGGQNCALPLFFLSAELIGRADLGVMAHHSFHGGIASAMLVYSVQEGSTQFDREKGAIGHTRFAKEIQEIIHGEAWGSMDITEPNAGSDMAALRAKGELGADGQWTVSGQKIFITSGHGKYHFVVAKTEEASTEDSAGLNGLSMFLVNAYEGTAATPGTRHIHIDRLEEKLGQHSSATCSLNFEKAPAQLVGKRGEGFRYMLTLMNNARVGVGFEAIGLMEAAYRAARSYAQDRHSMGKRIADHEMIADYLDEMENDVRALRALAVESSYHTAMFHMLDIGLCLNSLSDRERHEERRSFHARRARRLTPLLKYLAAEKAVLATQRAVIIHGGSGYTKDYAAEKLYRDAMVIPIYEGTSQIQSLMVMKDTLQAALQNPSAFAKRLGAARWKATSARDPLARRIAKLEVLSLASQQHLLIKTAADKYRSLRGTKLTDWPEQFTKNWNPKRDFSFAMLHAEKLTQQLADEAICQILFEQSQKHADRRVILEHYLERAEPRARYLHEQITHTGQRLLAQLYVPEQKAV